MSFPRGTQNSQALHRSFFRLEFLQIQSPGFIKTTDSSGGETPGATSLPGSLTVEAALVLTLVIFSWTALITLFSAMQIHMKLRYAMEQTAEEFAMLAYLTQEDGVTTLALYSRILAIVGQDVLEESCIRGGSQGITLLGSSGLTEDGDVDICLTYYIEIPYLPFPFSGMVMSQRVIRHAWVGASPSADSAGISGSGTSVYVTENGSVYHESTSCTHLKLSVRSVSLSQVEYLRSKDGSCYYPCERCASGSETGNVYITSEGNRYHSNTDCGSLKRTVETVERTETALPPCSKCCSEEN